MDLTKIGDHLTILVLSTTGVELLHDAVFQDWIKIAFQGIITLTAVLTLFKNSKGGFRKKKPPGNQSE